MDGNLEGILSRIGSIQVRAVSDYKEKGNPVMVAGNTERRPLRHLEGSMIPVQSLLTTKYIIPILSFIK